jgi:hypothetical protein
VAPPENLTVSVRLKGPLDVEENPPVEALEVSETERPVVGAGEVRLSVVGADG